VPLQVAPSATIVDVGSQALPLAHVSPASQVPSARQGVACAPLARQLVVFSSQ
jgi:hypothetical protein